MKHYKDPKTNEVFAFAADGSDDGLIPSNLVEITAIELEAIQSTEVLDAFNALTYAQKREREYPPVADYLDGIVKGDQAQIDAYTAACLAVKAKYPKPE